MLERIGLALALVATLGTGVASATTVPFLEDFDANAVLWEDTDNNPIAWVASGGPDGGSYISAAYNYFGFFSPFGGGPVLFRATGSDGASGGAFIGDWLADGVASVSFWMRHDAAAPLTPFARVAGAANFPGAVLDTFAPVLPNTWTEVTIPLAFAPPFCIGEGVDCVDAFVNVANFQLGTDAPEALTLLDQAITVDIDKVSLNAVPEPATALLIGCGLFGLGFQGWRRA